MILGHRRRGPGSFRDKDLTYAATARCACGGGLAYGRGMDYWDCSSILKGEAIPKDQAGSVEHSARAPFVFYEIKSELQPSAAGRTTRPTRES